ncbi:MAG: plastocyanin/azurin family copper-binding protein [Gemmatimonadales bacterium]
MTAILAACGGKPKGTAAESTAMAPPAAAETTAAAPAGPAVTINMTGNGTTTAKYQPDSVTISPGTTLHFVNVSGGPHNFSLWPDSIPAGAAAAMAKAMPDSVGYLQSQLLTAPNQTLDVTFTDAPPGEYKAYCLPHLPLGMRLWITVK